VLKKVFLFVIPNEVRDLLFEKSQENSRFLTPVSPGFGMTAWRVFQHPVSGWRRMAVPRACSVTTMELFLTLHESQVTSHESGCSSH
jgi:hypothetical protein